MGYCTYTVRPSDGAAAAAWIGTGTDQGRSVTVSYAPGSCTPPSSQRCKDLRCNDARNQFCKKYGCTQVPVGGNCAKRSISENESAKMILNAAESYCNQQQTSDPNGINNAKHYQSAVTAIRNALARGDCVTASNAAYSAGKAFAGSYGCNGLHYGGASKPATGGGGGSTSAPKDNTDPWNCDGQWGQGSFLAGQCKFWNGLFGGVGTSINKGGEAFGQLGDPVGKYLPLFLLGGGIMMVALLLKR